MSGSSGAAVQLQAGTLSARIQAGELVGFSRSGHEFMHQETQPGWNHTDTEMFPIIGPTEANGYRVHVPRGNAMQDQHGLLREVSYSQSFVSATEAVFKKTYVGGTPVPNSKFPERSTARWLVWPYSFAFEKRFHLTEKALEVTFEISGERDMPFMLGYHPAFNLQRAEARVEACGTSIPLTEVLEVGNRALPVRECQTLALHDVQSLRIRTEGFGHAMLWSPDPCMICIEPITFYPYDAGPAHLHEGFRFLGEGPEQLRCVLEPL